MIPQYQPFTTNVRYYSPQNRQTQARMRQELTEGSRPWRLWIYLQFKLSHSSLFLCPLKAPKMCINSTLTLTLTLIQTLGNIHIFWVVGINMVLRNKDGFLLAIIHYVCGEWFISWYHCNLQIINCRMRYNLLSLLAFVWLRPETALAPSIIGIINYGNQAEA